MSFAPDTTSTTYLGLEVPPPRLPTDPPAPAAAPPAPASAHRPDHLLHSALCHSGRWRALASAAGPHTPTHRAAPLPVRRRHILGRRVRRAHRQAAPRGGPLRRALLAGGAAADATAQRRPAPLARTCLEGREAASRRARRVSPDLCRSAARLACTRHSGLGPCFRERLHGGTGVTGG